MNLRNSKSPYVAVTRFEGLFLDPAAPWRSLKEP